MSGTPSPAGKAKNVCNDKWLKVLAPSVTGIDEVDMQATQNFTIMCTCFEDMIAEPKVVPGVFSCIRDEKQKLAAKKHLYHQDQAQFKQECSIHTSEESLNLAFVNNT